MLKLTSQQQEKPVAKKKYEVRFTTTSVQTFKVKVEAPSPEEAQEYVSEHWDELVSSLEATEVDEGSDMELGHDWGLDWGDIKEITN